MHFLQAYLEYFSKVEHILAQKATLNTFQKVQVIPSVFSDNSAMKLEIKKNTTKKR